MFGKKKKESKIEEQPLPIEPVEDFLDAEIIEDDDLSPEIIADDVEGEDINLDAIDDLSGAIGDQRSSVNDIMITQGLENIPNDVFLETADFDIEKPQEEQAEPIADESLSNIEEATLEEEPVEELVLEETSVEEEPIKEIGEEPTEETSEELDEEELAAEEETSDEEEEEETSEEPEAAEDEINEEVVYVVDGPEEDDEIVHASKLVKLPHLIDYIVNSDPKPSKKALMKYAMMLAELYKKCKNADDKKIVKDCVMKVANALR